MTKLFDSFFHQNAQDFNNKILLTCEQISVNICKEQCSHISYLFSFKIFFSSKRPNLSAHMEKLDANADAGSSAIALLVHSYMQAKILDLSSKTDLNFRSCVGQNQKPT